MPGIIPMKLIKCGSSQTRIAQACDRCRSKKIRCDGVRPCCSQCANVGFECKTSDKLSRRAFPRGYTESLEERVRSLEREVRELKDLLDAKDEQLDMLSRIHSFSPYSPPASAASGVASNKSRKSPDLSSRRSESVDNGPPEEMIVVGESAGLVKTESGGDGIYMGASSGRPFVNSFKQMMDETGRPLVDFQSGKFFEGLNETPLEISTSQVDGIKAPPRLLSDHLLVSYFQEYHPLFPVLHRPTFLASYEKLVAGDHNSLMSLSKHAIAQLFLVFAIALQQSEPRNSPDRRLFDGQWQAALNCVISESSINTLQCLVLAQLYCISRGEYTRLLHYKSIATSISMRLGLNHSQRKFSLGALAGEMRKRALWCVYCLDTFSAAILGIPRLLKDECIETEYPSDIDDEYVSEEGFLPTLPGDSTRISSALALFRLSRILATVLDSVYPSSLSHELSYSKLKELEEDVDRWKSSLAPHLRLEFANGTPATNIVHSRSPLLVMAYHYTRVLIHRPVANSTYTRHSSASLLAIRESSKCIIQIVQLLTERKLGFSFCLNKPQLLVQSAFGILYCAAISPPDGVLVKENQRLISAVLEELKRGSSPALAHELGIVVSSMFSSTPQQPDNSSTDDPRISPPVSPPQSSSSSVQPEPHPVRRRMSSISAKLIKSPGGPGRTNSHDFGDGQPLNNNQRRLTSASLTDLSPPSRSRSLYQLQKQQQVQPRPMSKPTGLHSRHSVSYEPTALDYMWNMGGNGNGNAHSREGRSAIPETARNVSADDWENMLAMMDASHAAHIYGDGGSTLLPSPSHTGGESCGQSPDVQWGLGAGGRGFHATPSLSSFSTLSDGSEENTTTGRYQERDERLGEYIGPMISTSGAENIVDTPLNGPAPLLVDEGWGFEH